MKPVAISIDRQRQNTSGVPMQGGYAINYACHSCGKPLSIALGKTEQFCHTCGESISWGVVSFMNKSQTDLLKKLYKEDPYNAPIFERGLLDAINALNSEGDFGEDEIYSIAEYEEEEGNE